MGISAENNYLIVIPEAAVQAIMDEFEDALQLSINLPRTPEGLVDLIGEMYGADDVIEFDLTPDAIHVNGHSYGKLGDANTLGPIMAAHGVTGIIWGEVDDGYFLEEFTNGEVKGHGGQVVFPTYHGTLYQP